MFNIMPGPVITDFSKNAILADGKAFGKTQKLIATGMKAERCAALNNKAIALIEKRWCNLEFVEL